MDNKFTAFEFERNMMNISYYKRLSLIIMSASGNIHCKLQVVYWIKLHLYKNWIRFLSLLHCILTHFWLTKCIKCTCTSANLHSILTTSKRMYFAAILLLSISATLGDAKGKFYSRSYCRLKDVVEFVEWKICLTECQGVGDHCWSSDASLCSGESPCSAQDLCTCPDNSQCVKHDDFEDKFCKEVATRKGRWSLF